MKICSISRIKNEEDIIETFIRYHLNFIDEMIIFEDNSSDDTYEILSKLKKENLPIHVFRNTKEHSEQQDVINIAFNKATGNDSTFENLKSNKPYYYVVEEDTGDVLIFMAFNNSLSCAFLRYANSSKCKAY